MLSIRASSAIPRSSPSSGKHESTSNPDSSERDRRRSSICAGYAHSSESNASVHVRISQRREQHRHRPPLPGVAHDLIDLRLESSIDDRLGGRLSCRASRTPRTDARLAATGETTRLWRRSGPPSSVAHALLLSPGWQDTGSVVVRHRVIRIMSSVSRSCIGCSEYSVLTTPRNIPCSSTDCLRRSAIPEPCDGLRTTFLRRALRVGDTPQPQNRQEQPRQRTARLATSRRSSRASRACARCPWTGTSRPCTRRSRRADAPLRSRRASMGRAPDELADALSPRGPGWSSGRCSCDRR